MGAFDVGFLWVDSDFKTDFFLSLIFLLDPNSKWNILHNS